MFCPKCGTINADDSRFCMKCAQSLEPGAFVTPPPAAFVPQQPPYQQQYQQIPYQQPINQGGARCPKCGGVVAFQTVAENKKRGVGMVLLWILLAMCTCGFGLLLIPLLTKKGSRINTWAVCQSCGYRYKA